MNPTPGALAVLLPLLGSWMEPRTLIALGALVVAAISLIVSGLSARASRESTRISKTTRIQGLLDEAMNQLGGTPASPVLPVAKVRSENLSAARKLVNRALDIDRESAIAHRYLAGCFYLAGETRRGIESIDEALRIEPKNNLARLGRLLLFFQARDWAAAEDEFEVLAREGESDADIQYNLGWFREEQDRLEAAAEHYGKACELDGESFQALEAKARVLERQGRNVEASSVHATLGKKHRSIGSDYEGLRALRRAEALNPSSTEYLVELGEALVERDGGGKAVPYLERASGIFENDPRLPILLKIARTMEGGEQVDDALKKALQLLKRRGGDSAKPLFPVG